MNIVILIGLILAGSTIAFDHLMNELPQWLAVLLGVCVSDEACFIRKEGKTNVIPDQGNDKGRT